MSSLRKSLTCGWEAYGPYVCDEHSRSFDAHFHQPLPTFCSHDVGYQKRTFGADTLAGNCAALRKFLNHFKVAKEWIHPMRLHEKFSRPSTIGDAELTANSMAEEQMRAKS